MSYTTCSTFFLACGGKLRSTTRVDPAWGFNSPRALDLHLAGAMSDENLCCEMRQMRPMRPHGVGVFISGGGVGVTFGGGKMDTYTL